MKANIAIWWLLTGFFALCTVAYVGWSVAWHWQDYQAGEIPWTRTIEWTGAIALLFSVFMAAMVAFFIQRWHASQKGVDLPEDRLDADIDDADPEMGEFSPWSWWPIVLATAPAVGVVGLAVGGTFLLPIAAGFLVVGLFGWVFEYYRGNFAR